MSLQNVNTGSQSSNDRNNDLKAFDEQQSGVKGLVDAGAETVPTIFIQPAEVRSKDYNTCDGNLSVPVVDLGDVDKGNGKIIKEILMASKKWGFFQVINHGIPLEVLDKMIEGARMFHEQDVEVKKKFYSRDRLKQATFSTNYDFYQSRAANWRDTLSVNTLFAGELQPQDLPPICRDMIVDYVNHIIRLGDHLLELISVALGLKPLHLQEMEGAKGWNLVCHYYPACPEPELTLGASKHSDPSFLTILLQDQIGGLQVLHDNQWVNVKPIRGSLIVNIGDILQIISNDKLSSVNHRVIANKVGPRISIAVFLTGLSSSPKLYKPIEELVSQDNQPVYREFTLNEFFTNFFSGPLYQSGTEYFKAQSS